MLFRSLTEVLNLDVAPFQKLLDQLNTAVPGKSNDVLRAYMDMKKGLASLPLYRLYLEDFRVFGDMPVEAFAVGEAQDAFAEFVMQEDHDLPAFMQQQIDDIRKAETGNLKLRVSPGDVAAFVKNEAESFLQIGRAHV